MARRSKGKVKVKVVADPIFKWDLIPESEMLEREAKYLSRLNDFGVSADLVKHAHSDFYEQEVERAAREHWDRHLRCDGLPRPYLPVEIRTFISKIRFYDEIESTNSMDWTLSVDERTILNQNIFRVDKRDMCLDTLKQMDVMLDNEAELVRMSGQRQKDIMEVC
uniref:Uncharacterized protein LOC108043238 n=1 Tax=Drosophila rhopaloa TaxID=1041015 RepID=A0A6P4EW67_DRORH